MQCDMCGSEGYLFKVEIEGTQLNVCKQCSKYGKIISRPRNPNFNKKKPKRFKVEKEPEKEVVELIVNDYASKIKNKREKLGLKQKELAIKMAERESLIQKVESGHIEPSMTLAKKFERFLKIKLIDSFEDKKDKSFRSKRSDLTIGDIINLKKR